MSILESVSHRNESERDDISLIDMFRNHLRSIDNSMSAIAFLAGYFSAWDADHETLPVEYAHLIASELDRIHALEFARRIGVASHYTDEAAP